MVNKTSNRMTSEERRILLQYVRAGKSDSEIAAEMTKPLHTIVNWKVTLGIGSKREAKRLRRKIANEIFSHAAKYVNVSELILKALERALVTSINAQDYIAELLSRKQRLTTEDFHLIYENQDQIIAVGEKYTDMLKEHRTLAEVEKWFDAFEKTFASMPSEHRKRFNEELEKNGIEPVAFDQYLTYRTESAPITSETG